MKNIVMLATANLRKNKSQSFTTALLILISALFLNVGMVIFFRMGGHFDARTEALNAPHWASFHENKPNMERVDFLRQASGVSDVEYSAALFGMHTLTIPSADAVFTYSTIIKPFSEAQRMNPPQAPNGADTLKGNGIIIPYFMSTGVEIGAELSILFGTEEVTFIVAGINEEIMFGSLMAGSTRVYVSMEMFEKMAARYPDLLSGIVTVRMEDRNDNSAMVLYFNTFAGKGQVQVWVTSLDSIREGRMSNPRIMSAVVMAFSLILLVVGLCIIRFNIVNSIEENTTNIGAQKAIGFRSYQIIAAVMLQFCFIAAAGSGAGVMLSQPVFPMLSDILRPMLGIPWHPLFDIPLMLISVTFILLAVAAFALLSARRITRLHPLNALRGGITTHSFCKVYLPLDRSPGSLTVLLAFKQLLYNKKQALMVGLIIAFTAFACMAGLTIHYNYNVNTDAMLRMVTGEIPDAVFNLNDAEELPAFRARIEARPEVLRVSSGGSTSMMSTLNINGRGVNVAIVGDFADFGGYELIRGRFPLYDNEIVIAAVTLSAMGVNIGDWVYILNRSEGTEYPFLVTGSTQSMNQNGMICRAGIARLGVYPTFSSLNVRLLAGYDIDEFIESVLAAEGDIFRNVWNMLEDLSDQFNALGETFAIIAAVILAVVSCVVILVLYLIIKTTIIRRRRELGIQKALGFTTLQLMNQIAINITPVITLGAIMGVLGGYFGFNPMFVMITRGFGIAQADLPVPTDWAFLLGAGLIALAYTVAMLVAWRIRKISAYALVTE
jgi:putative ABC transport system permease protein